MRMKALQRFPYNGQQLEIGDHFDVEHDIHGGIFEHKGWAEKADKQDAPKKQVPPLPRHLLPVLWRQNNLTPLPWLQ